MKQALLSVFILLVFAGGYAQPGCPDVNAGSDAQLPCGTNCTTLNATAFQTGATTTYSVASIPYTPFSYTAGTSILVNTDDIWSDVIPLPFTFCFFGQAYNNVVVGANGLISFDQSVANSPCIWDLTGAGSLPTNNVYGNVIMGPYHDIDPSLGGTIKYQIIGAAPCRIFVVSYYQVPMYNSDDFLSTCSGLDATHQIAIYETTNAIEIYIAHKESCPDGGFFSAGWNDGLAIEGIQDASQTTAFTVPGRNNTVWDVNNDAWRFTPTGASIVSIAWLQGGSQIGTGPSVQVCPGTTTTYTAQATYLPCAGGTPVVVTDDVTISLAGLQVSATGQDISCFGAADGQATGTLTGGTAPITYGWNNAPGQLSINGLSPGTYVFTASDAANCVRSDTVIIAEPAQITANVPDVNQTNCSGTGTGTLVATATGGTGAYSFVWSSTPVQNDSILNGVAPGNYTITVTDATGCTASDAGTLAIQAGGNNVVLNVVNATNLLCNGGGNGSITVSATGGSGVFTYTWSTGATGATLSNLSGGTFTVTADDGGGCTATTQQAITEPSALSFTGAVQNIGCGATATGLITINATGGTGSYTYSWVQQSNNQSSSGNPLTVNQPDTYNLTVTDANGCNDTANYAVTQVPALTFTQSSTNLTCNGSNNGTATINVTTGTPPYSYDWNGAGNTSNATVQNLPAGATNVTITDANCSATATFNITEPAAVTVALVSSTDALCNGSSDGTVTVSAGGGTGSSYTYSWSNNQTGATATGLAANTNYTVTAFDGNNCSVSGTYTVGEPTALSTAPLVTDAICNGTASGKIDMNPSGGTPPYTFLWATGQTTQVATGLTAGPYTFAVTDANNCSSSNTATVGEPAAMNFHFVVMGVKCPGDENGSITIDSASGGTPPYNYSATIDNVNIYSTSNTTIENLAAGDYTVLISDNSGCSRTYTQTVPNASVDNYEARADSTTCYGPDYNDGVAHITTTPQSAQNGPYQYSIDGGALQYSGDFFGLLAGAHTITAVNNNGCTTQVPVVVLQPLPIVVDIEPDTVYLALGETKQVIATYINAGEVTYLWTPALGLSCIDCPNPTVNVYQNTDYLLTVSMQHGTSTCYGSATLHAAVEPHKPVYIPNAFSPNGDGNNDVFTIYGEGISTVELTIFNRWGELIFKSANAFEGWDGTYKSVLQLPGVYTYNAAITFLDGKTTREKGTVTIVR